MRDYFILLTGSKNNAGDYLIKHRAKQLFEQLRKDRDVVDIDSWIPFSDEQLELVNGSKALILTGGPALRPDIYPNIYPLVTDLKKIKVPIITMGVGWKSRFGDWEDTKSYSFTKESRELIDRINSSGFVSSVRDYHSLNSLMQQGYHNFVMTGCPALYDSKYIKQGFPDLAEKDIRSIAYSLGVSFVNDSFKERSMQNDILKLQSEFKDKSLKVIFHHSLNTNTYKDGYGNQQFIEQHIRFANWLKQNHIEYEDISGGVNKLIDLYSSCDIHIGYRVHAHIFMSSISRPSILLAEDGRGKALRNVISGLILDGNVTERIHGSNDILQKIKRKLNFTNTTSPNLSGSFGTPTLRNISGLTDDLMNNLQYELRNGFPRLSLTRYNIDAHFTQMKNFISQLP